MSNASRAALSNASNDWKTNLAGGVHAPLDIVDGTDEDIHLHVRRTGLPVVQIGGEIDIYTARRDPCAVRLRIWIPALPGRDWLAMSERERFVHGNIGSNGPIPPSVEKVDAAAHQLAQTVVQYTTLAAS